MTFDFTPTDDGLRIHDQIENVWTDIDAGGRVEPEPARTDVFSVPLDDAVRFNAAEIEFSNAFLTTLYDKDREIRAMYQEGGRVPDTDFHEIDCTPSGMKAYVQVENTAVTVMTDQTTTLSFDQESSVLLGVRSNHERPATVVTTTSDPRDLMQAISTFGTAMKTFSPERAFPTLRGHPPELAVKSSLQIPDEVASPDTGVKIGVPSDIASIFTVAPLAYYLGATVVENPEPVLTAAGKQFPLDEPSLAHGVKRILQHCFTLDCLVRTAGLYPVELKELEMVKETVSLDTDALYAQPLDERTASYMDYPFEVFDDFLPWPTVTNVTPQIRNTELLPYLCYRLSAIRSPPHASERTTIAHEREARIERTPSGVSAEYSGSLPVVTPEDLDAHHVGWVGETAPRSGTIPILDSFVTALDESPRTGSIDVHVVCTDTTMEEEVDSIYQGRTDQPFEVAVSKDVTTDQLRGVLSSDIDFLHFVGHSTVAGLQCTNGTLDLATLPPGNYPAFFLNGCQSYYQGRILARKGSVGGLVSLAPIENEMAIPAGRLIANLLAFGCTFSQTLAGLHRWSPLEYTALGDGDFRLCASEDYTPIALHLCDQPGHEDSLSATTEILGEVGTELGVLVAPAYIDDSAYGIRIGYTTDITWDDVRERLAGHWPFVVDDDIYWSPELDETRLRELLAETN